MNSEKISGEAKKKMSVSRNNVIKRGNFLLVIVAVTADNFG